MGENLNPTGGLWCILLDEFNDHIWSVRINPNSRLRELMIELTTHCNYDCIYCFRRRMTGEEKGFLDYKLYQRIIDEGLEIGLEKISLSGWGEPLLHPNIIDIVRYAKERGVKVLLNTNGYFLGKYIDELYSLGVDEIVVSIDSPYPDVYRTIRIGGDLPRLINALLKLKEYRIRDVSPVPQLYLQFTINKYNYKNLAPMIKLAKELGASKITVSNIIPITKDFEEKISCYMDKECIKNVEKLRMELARISLDTGVEVSLPNFSNSYSERTCPFAQRNALYIRWDGKVAPCIYYAHHWRNVLFGVEREIYPVILGDLNRESLKDIWYRNKLVFRFKTYYMDYPSCLDCPLRDYCTITLDNRMDCWGNTPSCASCPYSRDMVRCPL